MLLGVDVLPDPAPNSPLVVYAALISAGVAILVLIASNYYNSKREYEKWRREQLITIILDAQQQLSNLKALLNEGLAHDGSKYTPILFSLTNSYYGIGMLSTTNAFPKRYTEVCEQLVEIFHNYSGQPDEQRVRLNKLQEKLSNYAKRELRRTTWGPIRKVLAIACLIVLLPLLGVLTVIGLGSSKLSTAIRRYRDNNTTLDTSRE